jgi:diaminopropionate ammonia-lyase
LPTQTPLSSRTAWTTRRSGHQRSRWRRCSSTRSPRARIALAPPPLDLIRSGHRSAIARRSHSPALREVSAVRASAAPVARASAGGHHGGTSWSSATSHSQPASAAANASRWSPTLKGSDPSRVAVAAFHRSLPGYAPTPLRELSEGVLLKDESERMGLPAFKILGASWAIERALRERGDVHTLVAASAGNHGRAVARVARERGLGCRVFLPERSAPARRAAIEGEGAEVIVGGGYEEAVAAAAREGERPGVLELADVGEDGPAAWVIDGYATLFAEIDRPVDVVLVPAGVGSLAAAAARWGAANDVEVWAVEPATAACVTASLAAGEPVTIPTPGTTMAPLDCAEVSLAAWPTLHAGLAGTVTVTDEETHQAMRDLAAAGLRIGDAGAAPLAALAQLRPAGTALLIATEGVTDPEGYAEVLPQA